jgi:signal transduction histidine kinase
VLAETLAARVDDAESAARLAARVGEESARLSLLVEDILDLSTAETSPSRFEPVRLATLLEDVTVANGERAAEYEVRLETERLDDGVVVMGDRRQLRSMLTNLLDNAIKYSRPGGDAEDSWPRVRLRAFAAGEWAVIEVEDEGIGIPESHQARIFERFYRVDRARSRATGGTGLGLSIVRNVVVNHGGDVVVESKAGEGSLFRVTLPLRKDEG